MMKPLVCFHSAIHDYMTLTCGEVVCNAAVCGWSADQATGGCYGNKCPCGVMPLLSRHGSIVRWLLQHNETKTRKPHIKLLKRRFGSRFGYHGVCLDAFFGSCVRVAVCSTVWSSVRLTLSYLSRRTRKRHSEVSSTCT